MFKKIINENGELVLVDSDFKKDLGIKYTDYVELYEKRLPALLDNIVIAYEDRKIDIAKNIFMALKELDWFNPDGALGGIGWLYARSEKVAQYRDEFDKYLMLM